MAHPARVRDSANPPLYSKSQQGKVTDLVVFMLVFIPCRNECFCKLRVRKSACLFSEWKGRGLPNTTPMFYLASFFYFISFDFRFPKWNFEENQRYYRKWQYAQRRFNRMETFFLQVSDDVYCEVCQCRFRKADKQYPCRICEGVFHRDCVLGITDVHPSHASTIERASVKIGWSCPACVSYIHM